MVSAEDHHAHPDGVEGRLAPRGIGESDGKVVVLDPLPKEAIETSVRIQVIRDLVDPFDWAWDVQHCLDYLEGEPGVDTTGMGLWATSMGGGVALWTAAHDPRIRCLVAQVAAQDARPLHDQEQLQGYHARAIRQARGEDAPLPQGTDAVLGLRGTPHYAKFYNWAPVEYSEQVTAPILLIDSEHEKLFDCTRNSGWVYERMKAAGRAPATSCRASPISRFTALPARMSSIGPSPGSMRTSSRLRRQTTSVCRGVGGVRRTAGLLTRVARGRHKV